MATPEDGLTTEEFNSLTSEERMVRAKRNPQTGMTESEGEEHILGMLSPDDPSEETDTGGEGDPDVEETSPESEEAPVEETEAVEPGPEESDEDVEVEDADEAPSDSELPQTVTVKVRGEEKEVPLEEAVRGYQRQEDYTRSKQEVAERRELVEQQNEALRDERGRMQAGLQEIEMFLEAVAPERPDPDLRETNPAEYAERFAEWEERQEQLQGVREEREKIAQESQQERQERLQKTLQREQERLHAAIPDWVDEDTAHEEKQEMIEYAQDEYSFTEQELSHVRDHRLLVMLRRAMKYDEAQAKTEEVRERAEAKAKSEETTLPPGRRSSKSKKPSPADEARQRLKQTGSKRDGEAAILDLLESED